MLNDQRGASIVEYALLIACIAVLVTPAVWYAMTAVEGLFERTAHEIDAPS